MITQFLGLLLAGFLLTFVGAVPFINLLYKLKFQRVAEVHTLIPVFTKLHAWKVGTPNSGGILVVVVTVLLGWLYLQPELSFAKSPALIIFVSLFLYGVLGLYDDIKKFFGYQKEKFWGLRMRYKFLLQFVIAGLVGLLIFDHLSVNGTVGILIPWVTTLQLNLWEYLPLAMLVVVASANAYNITDGLDGLASGLLIMSLLALAAITLTVGGNPFMATPYPSQLTAILGVWVGAMLAFLYFNIHPARVWMGDSGALAFGGTLGVMALLLGIPLVWIVIGGIYVLETLSSLLQWYSMRFRPKKFFLIAPVHHHFEALGWPETKVTMRFWLVGAVLTLTGLFTYFLIRFGL